MTQVPGIPDANIDELLETEVDDVDETDAVARNAAPVSYFGTEFDVHGLVRRFNANSIVVPRFDPSEPLPDPLVSGFQRGRVWRRAQQDRFIESLLLGYPVPGIVLVEQPEKKYLVLDGQQRLTTLAAFYAGKFALRDVEDDLKGSSYDTLPDDLQRSLDDTFIQAIIIRPPQSVEEYESVYQIFERLNSGGTHLQPHEIRVALYGGPTVEKVREMNSDGNWRQIFGRKSDRLKDQELILRVIALYVEADSYQAPLKTFLNNFLGRHRAGNDLRLEELSTLFLRAAEILARRPRMFRLGNRVNAAILESVFVAVMSRLSGADVDHILDEAWLDAYDSLIADEEYLDAVTKATANEEAVSTRLRKARETFARL